MLVVYTGNNEIIVYEKNNEKQVLNEYFNQNSGRNIEDYNREEFEDSVCISTRFITR